MSCRGASFAPHSAGVPYGRNIAVVSYSLHTLLHDDVLYTYESVVFFSPILWLSQGASIPSPPPDYAAILLLIILPAQSKVITSSHASARQFPLDDKSTLITTNPGLRICTKAKIPSHPKPPTVVTRTERAPRPYNETRWLAHRICTRPSHVLPIGSSAACTSLLKILSTSVTSTEPPDE